MKKEYLVAIQFSFSRFTVRASSNLEAIKKATRKAAGWKAKAVALGDSTEASPEADATMWNVYMGKKHIGQMSFASIYILAQAGQPLQRVFKSDAA